MSGGANLVEIVPQVLLSYAEVADDPAQVGVVLMRLAGRADCPEPDAAGRLVIRMCRAEEVRRVLRRAEWKERKRAARERLRAKAAAEAAAPVQGDLFDGAGAPRMYGNKQKKSAKAAK